MTLEKFLAAVRQYRRTFVAVTAAVFGAGLAAILFTPARYVSTTDLMVSISGSTTAAAYQNDEVVMGRVNSYIALLGSDVVSQRVIDKLGLTMTAPELAAKISATNVPPDTAVIDVAVSDESPQRARLLAATLANEFISYTAALEAATGEDGQKVRTTIVGDAREPNERIAQHAVLVVLAALAAALLGAVAVWVKSLSDPVVRTAEKAAAAAGVPVIGHLTEASAATIKDLENYRRLRNQLRALTGRAGGARERVRVLLLACAVGEVDTATVASNLGRVMTLAGVRTIVLDAQMSDTDGAPAAQSTPFENVDDRKKDEQVGPGDGDCESQPGEDDLPELDTLAIGAWAENADRLATVARAAFFDDLRSRYAVVIVSAAPVLATSAASVVGEYADEVVLLVGSGATRRQDLRTAAEGLRSAGLPLVGAVLVGQYGGGSEAAELPRAAGVSGGPGERSG